MMSEKIFEAGFFLAIKRQSEYKLHAETWTIYYLDEIIAKVEKMGAKADITLTEKCCGKIWSESHMLQFSGIVSKIKNKSK